jgi:predicted permease
MLLVVVAALFVQTLVRLGGVQLGFRPDNLILFDLQPPQTQYRGPATLTLYRQLEQKLGVVPGVESVTLLRVPLISGNVSYRTIVPAGTQRKPDNNPSTEYNSVGESFFTMFRIPIVAGRGFNASDTETSRKVAVVNQSFAKKFYPDLNPIGRTFESGLRQPYTVEIVGVCADTKYDSVRKSAEPSFFVPWRQEGNGIGAVTFVVKTRGGTAAIVPSVRRVVAAIDGNLPLLNVRTQDEQIAASLQRERVFANLTGGFGVLALVLASIGIYGIMAYAVSRRTNEIGIRMALGAQPGRVQQMVLGEASWMVAAGVAVGIAGALALGRLIGTMLYGLKPWDPSTFALSAALLILVALGASWIPARRAAGVDPMKALRHE